MMKKSQIKILASLLYSLPIIFFLVSYFLITTSGEDIFQGANNFRTGLALNPLGDAINAFNFNSRITDMYAWPVIDYFDYQFAFGPDIIFRLIDVIMASAVFYFATYIILSRKPKLIIKDALIFCAIFSVFIVTPIGRVFYLEFSMIHNYVPPTLAVLIFSIPFLKLIQNQSPTAHPKLLNIFLPLLGLYIGMASTITPLAILATIIFYCIIKRKNLTRPPLWFFSSLICIMVGFLICWLIGSGIEHYAKVQATTFDYILFSNLFSAPAVFISKIFQHELYNFGIVFLLILAIFVLCYVFSKPKIKVKKLDSKTKNIILAFSIFIVVHLLGTSLIKAPFRLLILPYFIGIIAIFKVFMSSINSKILATIITIFTFFILLTHTILLIKYHNQASIILTEIKESSESALCIEESRTLPIRLHFIDLSQANFLVNWGYPEPIYGKNITFCKE